MGREQNIICDFCRVRVPAAAPMVPSGWATLVTPAVGSRVFCGLTCVVKWVDEFLAKRV